MGPPASPPPEGSAGSAEPMRLSGRAIDETLELLIADGTLRRGDINLISLQPIAERLGERWTRKREEVWLHVESFLRRQFRPEDLIVRLDEFNVLVAQPGREPLSSQSLCVRAAGELMKFFIGETTAQQVRVSVVEAVAQGEITVRALPRERLEAMVLAHGPEMGKPERVKSTPILTRFGRSVAVAVSLEPLWSLRPAVRKIGHHVKVTLSDGATGALLTTHDRFQLQPGELADIDTEVLKTAVAVRAASPKLAGSLIIPISYWTLTNSSTRYQLLQEVQRLGPADQRSFGWEIVDLEPGIPPGRLSELVGIARRHCRGVVCKLDLSVANAAKVQAAGATLSIEPPPHGYTELALFRLEGPMATALKTVRAVMLHDIPADLLPIATFIGVTHCTATPSSG